MAEFFDDFVRTEATAGPSGSSRDKFGGRPAEKPVAGTVVRAEQRFDAVADPRIRAGSIEEASSLLLRQSKRAIEKLTLGCRTSAHGSRKYTPQACPPPLSLN